ncbi:MAG: AAA family ATPase [Deltaproteobacteria bacterium]|jgi:general secretion pathway protein A|nr:AAA family ATPase [Deltaproteobacteria bacterium]
MYCDFFGFSEKPFTITPNPHFVFLSSIHREAFARLLYGVDSHAGFIALTGEVGTGKTTMLRTLLAQLDPEKYTSALIFNPCLSGEQLLAGICRELGVEADERNRSGYLDALNRFLIEQNSAGRTVVLVIDEAQNLAPDVLEQVRMISNLETERDKLIQIILAGQPELNDVLRRHDLRQLNQRITVRSRLTPIKLDDAAHYINHRLKISGSRIPDIFSPAAVKRIYRFSHGIPRLINVACEQALVMAWTRELLSVSSSMAAEVIKELQSVDGSEGFWNRISRRLFAGK